ncbi:MAG TPA: hypothetical protein VJK54_04600 [Chthoniobacterales bacterium]|nr:hypothetical protein [Chthoniobacterales bacterium]
MKLKHCSLLLLLAGFNHLIADNMSTDAMTSAPSSNIISRNIMDITDQEDPVVSTPFDNDLSITQELATADDLEHPKNLSQSDSGSVDKEHQRSKSNLTQQTTPKEQITPPKISEDQSISKEKLKEICAIAIDLVTLVCLPMAYVCFPNHQLLSLLVVGSVSGLLYRTKDDIINYCYTN